MGAAGRKKGNSAGPEASGFEPNVRSEPGAGRAARANQRRRLAAPERWPPRPALLFVRRRPREPHRDSRPAGSAAAARGGGPRRRAGSASPGRRPPRPPSPAPRSHVGEHGGAAAPGHDQPVRAGGGLCGRPGEAAAAGGPLAVRDRPEHVFPRNQHSQRPPPPADDVHPQQHAGHTAQLPRRTGHVLQAARVRGPAERQPHDGRRLLAPRKLQPLLGLVPAQPPGRLDAALLPDGPQLPPPPPPTAHVAPRSPAGGRPAESHGRRGRPEMRLDTPRG